MRHLTDKQIVERFRRADALLAEYEKLVLPAGKELARRKSLYVFKKPGKYRAELGCYEMGKDSVCLHLKGKPKYGRTSDLAYAFGMLWNKRLEKVGVTRVFLHDFF